MTRPWWRAWALSLLGSALTGLTLLVAAVVVGDARALAAVSASLLLLVGVAGFSLPVLAALGLAPSVAFLVAMSTYGLQVVLGGLLLQAGRPGGPLAELLDPRWLGVCLVALAVVVTVGVVLDQLRAARFARLAPVVTEGGTDTGTR